MKATKVIMEISNNKLESQSHHINVIT